MFCIFSTNHDADTHAVWGNDGMQHKPQSPFFVSIYHIFGKVLTLNIYDIHHDQKRLRQDHILIIIM